MKETIQRKNTMVDPPATHKDLSPLQLPNFKAAFKPFKKRSLSVADSSQVKISENVGLKKREEKAARKLGEALQQS